MIGYKAFDEYLINRYGFEFELGKEYTVSGNLRFGINGNGFHFCTNLEDTLRFVDGTKAIIVQIEALGNLKKYDDEYNEYYDMYVTDKIKMLKIINREEIFNYTLSLNDYKLVRMIRDYKNFSEDEIKILEEKYQNNIKISLALSYYQRGNKDAYEKIYRK